MGMGFPVGEAWLGAVQSCWGLRCPPGVSVRSAVSTGQRCGPRRAPGCAQPGGGGPDEHRRPLPTYQPGLRVLSARLLCRGGEWGTGLSFQTTAGPRKDTGWREAQRGLTHAAHSGLGLSLALSLLLLPGWTGGRSAGTPLTTAICGHPDSVLVNGVLGWEKAVQPRPWLWRRSEPSAQAQRPPRVFRWPEVSAAGEQERPGLCAAVSAPEA